MIQRNIFRVAYEHPTRVPNPKSKAYADGVATHNGGGWWRGCPHVHDSQAFCDWQAGWHKANQSK